MQNQTGLFIVLEGSDGSGKTTQFEALKKRLTEAGHQVEVFDFPRYTEPSSYFVARYLNGEYGPANSVNPYTASLFYALDRYEAAPLIRKALQAGKIVLSNRYVGSNMAHQGTKFSDAIEKRSFFIWEDSIEFQLFNIPRPTLNLFLRLPAEVSYELIAQKKQRSYTNDTRDQHEADIDHLRKAVETYDLLCQLFPRDFQAIECVQDGKLLDVNTISQKIWNTLEPLLPRVEASVPTPDAGAPARPQEVLQIGRTISRSDVLEYRWDMPRISYLAAIEMLSKLSNLKINNDSWAGAGSDYTFHSPQALSAELKDKYETIFRSIAKSHRALHLEVYNGLVSVGRFDSLSRSQAAKKSTEVLRAATPLAAYTSARLIIPKDQAYETLKKISLIQNEEVQTFGADLSKTLRELWPALNAEVAEIIEQQSMPEAIGSIIEKLAHEMVPRKTSSDDETVKLLEAHPRNEFDLIADGLSSYSTMPRAEIIEQMGRWSYQQKIDALNAALLKSPDTLDKASYRTEYLKDWQSFRQMLVLGLSGDIQRQLASPSDGYDVPGRIEEAVLEDSYNDIFKQSQDAYGILQSEHDGRTLEYATLLGHKLRWQIVFSASNVDKILHKAEFGPLAKPLKTLIATVHPTVAAYIGNYKTKRPGAKPSGTKTRSKRRHSSKK